MYKILHNEELGEVIFPMT